MKSLRPARLFLLLALFAANPPPARPQADTPAASQAGPLAAPQADTHVAAQVDPPAASSIAGALAWANSLRAGRGLTALEADSLLERCAREYAQELAASGSLTHRDSRGRKALGRYREAGGSAVRVGEVLGAGSGLAAVTAAWGASPAHAAVVLRPEWTHAGAGAARRGSSEVWVLLFAEQAVAGFRLTADPAGGYTLNGRFRAEEAREPVLICGLQVLKAREWEPRERRFVFAIPAAAAGIYHRLGYRTADGRWVLAAAFVPRQAATSSPETAPR
jgi:uncharacterized protein YkwD